MYTHAQRLWEGGEGGLVQYNNIAFKNSASVTKQLTVAYAFNCKNHIYSNILMVILPRNRLLW